MIPERMCTAKSISSDFEKWKIQTLDKVDRSIKGSVDALIQDLVTFINQQDCYCTTSSCSGRICVLSDNVELTVEQSEEAAVASKTKNCTCFFVSHEQVTTIDILKSLNKLASSVKLKFEGFVMHVRCKRLEDAKYLLNSAVASGFRNSGISLGKQSRNIMVAIRGTHCLEVPLSNNNGELLVSEEYINHVVKVANAKFIENLRRILQFEKYLRQNIPKLSNASKIIKSQTKTFVFHDLKNKIETENCFENAVGDIQSLFDTL